MEKKQLRWLIALLAATPLLHAGCSDGTDRPVAGFELHLGSTSIGALQNSAGLLRVQVKRKQGFTGAIEIGLAKPPAGVSARTVVVEAAEEVRLPLRITADVAVGPLMLTISGVGGGVTVTANLEVNVVATQPRSQALIQAALDAGQIDYGTSLVNRAYAVFGDPRLPVDFVGSGPAEEDTGLFVDIERDRATLSAAVLEQLQLFLVRPNDPLSIFNAAPLSPFNPGPPLNPASRPINRVQGALTANDKCSGATREWITARSARQPVRVWTLCEGNDLSDLIAETNLLNVLDVVDKAYGKMVTLMGPAVPDETGDDLIDIYVVPANADAPREAGDYAVEDVRGVAPVQPPFAGSTSSGYVMLPTWRLAEADYQLTVIHELFHVLQFAHNYTIVDDWWFTEASATWASFHFNRTAPVRPPANRDLHQERFGCYQSSWAGLLSLDDDHAYESYIWPFFMEQKSGGPTIIGGTWKQVESATTADGANNVLDFVFPFKDNFRDFALRNLNESYLPGDPLPRADRYIDLDPVFPEHVGPVFKNQFKSILVGTADSLKFDKPVEPLAAVYFEAEVKDPAVKKIVFDLEGMRLTGIDIAALVMINGTWESKPRDLNGQGELQFCLDRPAEKLGKIVFIVSNYQKEAGATVAPSLRAKAFAEPCGAAEWQGTFRSVQSANRHYLGPINTDILDLRLVETWTVVATSEAGMPPNTHQELSVRWSASYQRMRYSDAHNYKCAFGSIGSESSSVTGTGDGTDVFTLTPVGAGTFQMGSPNYLNPNDFIDVIGSEEIIDPCTPYHFSGPIEDRILSLRVGVLSNILRPDEMNDKHYTGSLTYSHVEDMETESVSDWTVTWDLTRR